MVLAASRSSWICDLARCVNGRWFDHRRGYRIRCGLDSVNSLWVPDAGEGIRSLLERHGESIGNSVLPLGIPIDRGSWCRSCRQIDKVRVTHKNCDSIWEIGDEFRLSALSFQEEFF